MNDYVGPKEDNEDDDNKGASWLKYWWIGLIVLAVLIVLFIMIKAKKNDADDDVDIEDEGEYTPV